MKKQGCVLCETEGGTLIVQTPKFRVIRADEAGFPAFYRVVWTDHVAEFSDLSPGDRSLCMDAVVAVEKALIQHLSPTKVNIAALGNAVPHLHWHVIARFEWDSHFPAPVWAAALRPKPVEELARIKSGLDTVERSIRDAFA